MYRDTKSNLVLSASDLVNYLYCLHLSKLSFQVANGENILAKEQDEASQVLQKRGDQHELESLKLLQDHYQQVVNIDANRSLKQRLDQTLLAMTQGAQVIYHGQFLNKAKSNFIWQGETDFLIKVNNSPSNLGSFSYEPQDAKLSKLVKPEAILQLCNYAEHLEIIQGNLPEKIHVITGKKDKESFFTSEFISYYKAIKKRFEQQLGENIISYPVPVPHCSLCAWQELCEQKRQQDQHLSLVALIRTNQIEKLKRAGITTVSGLASSSIAEVKGLREQTFIKLRRQAKLLTQSLKKPDLAPCYELLPDQSLGLAALPEACEGDLFFDIEGDPYIQGGLEYLFGVGFLQGGIFHYKAFWAHDRQSEKLAFEELIDFISQRRKIWPQLHIYHYAPYEPSALTRLMGSHGTREKQVDDLLRSKVLVDLYKIVRQGLCIGVSSYSLKKLEPLYMEARAGEITNAASSIVGYENWLETRDIALLASLQDYNEVDCDSTLKLRDWLLKLRRDFSISIIAQVGDTSPTDEVIDEPKEAEVVTGQLLEAKYPGLAPQEFSSKNNPYWLLAQLANWHSREEKPQWWKYFSRINAPEEDLWQDSEAIAGLEYLGEVGREKKSILHKYSFDPTQDSKILLNSRPLDSNTGKNCGVVEHIDPIRGIIVLKRAVTSKAPHPISIIPAKPVKSDVMKKAILKLAKWVLEFGIDSKGPYRAARDLLLGYGPRFEGSINLDALYGPDEDMAKVAILNSTKLDNGCLAIQGPPGSGKTYIAAHIIIELVKKGNKVGITANSHSAVSNLVKKIIEVSTEQKIVLNLMQKITDSTFIEETLGVEFVKSNQNIKDALLANEVDIVAGTTWLFADDILDQQLDYLIVDEAGQLSLANTIAASCASKNLILIGDPQQLPQPLQGSHPVGAEVSSLEHLLKNKPTLDPKDGLFLDISRRMHPKICSFISELSYSGRLKSNAKNQLVEDGPLVAGAGIFWVPITHESNKTSCIEEAESISRYYKALIGRNWINSQGEKKPLSYKDLIVVAPYNAQVGIIKQHLPSMANVGTVDKFQGQEAAVVFISLTVSNAQDIPRGMEFLYSKNRLNVAISRAKAMAIVFGSAQLLTPKCNSIEQMKLVNGLCRLVELSTSLN